MLVLICVFFINGVGEVLTSHLKNEIGILFIAIISIKLILFHISFNRYNRVSLFFKLQYLKKKFSNYYSLINIWSHFIHLDFAKELFEGAMTTFIEAFFFFKLRFTYNNTYTSWENPGDWYNNWNSRNKS